MTVAVPTPIRRYFVRLGVSMSVYVAALLAGTYLVQHALIRGPILWFAALLPGLALVGAFYAIGMLIVETKDEFLRMLLVRQVLYASVLAMSLATVWGFLENFELAPHVPAFYWAIAWFVGFGLGGWVNRLTLGTSGSCP
jgi:hypothetical protein